MRILIIEDLPGIAQSLKRGLEGERFDVTVLAAGEQAQHLISVQIFDLVLLDSMQPSRDGVEVLHTLRQRGLTTLVIVLSARDVVADRVRFLDLGADDYLVKPVVLDELLARIRALMRRRPPPHTYP